MCWRVRREKGEGESEKREGRGKDGERERGKEREREGERERGREWGREGCRDTTLMYSFVNILVVWQKQSNPEHQAPSAQGRTHILYTCTCMSVVYAIPIIQLATMCMYIPQYLLL